MWDIRKGALWGKSEIFRASSFEELLQLDSKPGCFGSGVDNRRTRAMVTGTAFR
jgi:hypothetical protein